MALRERKDFFVFKTMSALLLLVLVFCASIMLGAKKISFKEFSAALLYGTSFENIFLQKQTASFCRTIIFSLRLPRSILAFMSGALLAGAGASFQMFFRNSLAEPGITGISSGATLGAVLAQTAGLSASLFGLIAPVNIFAFAGAVCAGAIITLISAKAGIHGSITLLLCGTALGTLFSSVSSIILLTKSRELHGIYTWILGSFNGRGWTEVGFISIPATVSAAVMFFCSGRLDIMAGGENTAAGLGLEVQKLRAAVLVGASLAVSASVCAGGTINFVGLIAPHIVRKIYGAKYNKGVFLIPLSMIWGAVIVLLSDTVARVVVAPAELPAGLITSLLGAPFFLSLVFAGRREI